MHRCEFYLIRYVPNVIRSEFVNIGVILRLLDIKGHTLSVRLTRNWGRVLCFDPNADITMLEALEDELRNLLLATEGQTEGLMTRLEDQLSNGLRIASQVGLTSPKGSLSQDPNTEMDRLMQLYVD